jgi:membrane-bound serine protease (ClpP class)
MVAIGVVLVLLGAALLVAEAHVPAGAFGLAGGISLTLGTILAMTAAGAGVAAIVAVAVGAGAIASLWVTVAMRKSLESQARKPASGSEALAGRPGVVRRWAGGDGQVLVDGALWRARSSWPDDDEGDLEAGDPVVVERVSGLTLGVRKAEEWEAPW